MYYHVLIVFLFCCQTIFFLYYCWVLCFDTKEPEPRTSTSQQTRSVQLIITGSVTTYPSSLSFGRLVGRSTVYYKGQEVTLPWYYLELLLHLKDLARVISNHLLVFSYEWCWNWNCPMTPLRRQIIIICLRPSHVRLSGWSVGRFSSYYRSSNSTFSHQGVYVDFLPHTIVVILGTT